MSDNQDPSDRPPPLRVRGRRRRRHGEPGRKLQSLFRDRDIRRILGDNLRAQWKTYLAAILAMAIVAGTTAGVALIMRDIVDAITQPERQGSVHLVAALVAAIFIVRGIASYIQVVMMSKAGLSVVARQQSRIYDKLLGQGISYFTAHESSNLVLRVTHGATAARAITDTVLTSYVRDLLSVLGLLGVMIYQQPFLSIIALLIAPFALLGVRGLLRRSRQMAEQELTSTGEIMRIMQETASGVRVIKAFSLEQRMARRMDRAIRDVRKRALSFARINAMTSPMMDTLSGLA
ncbi:MAG TPA: ABC transporter transmembrane domain-containing protein, partial [Paracoccaceae bacterium]|nr:ABC transporter transmembrane domain-containing protein [Paracoccaceae bacterium]